MTRQEMEYGINKKCVEHPCCNGCPLDTRVCDVYALSDDELKENYELMFGIKVGENKMKLKDLIDRIGNSSTKIELRADDTILCTCSVQSPVLDVYGEREVKKFAISQDRHNTLIIIIEGSEGQ